MKEFKTVSGVLRMNVDELGHQQHEHGLVKTCWTSLALNLFLWLDIVGNYVC